jgi:hypothetical protein
MAVKRSEDYAHLQAAFDALNNGDELLIAPGEYFGGGAETTKIPLSADGRGIYVLTPKTNITVTPLGEVIIAPCCVTDGIFLLGCSNWTFGRGLTIRDAYGDGYFVDGRKVNYFFHTPRAHTGGFHLCECSDISVDTPIIYDNEVGFHPEDGDHITLLDANIYNNGQAGIRNKDCAFLTIQNCRTFNNGLYTNRVHQNPALTERASMQGLCFYGGDDLLVDGLISYGNQEDAILNYCGNMPRTATRVTIRNCQLQANKKGEHPLVVSYINMADSTWEISNNGLWNETEPAGGYLRIDPPSDPHTPWTPPAGYSNPLSFAQMALYLERLNPLSVGNYLLKELPSEIIPVPPRSRFARFEQAIMGRRPAPGIYDDNGNFLMKGEATPFSFTGSVQPLDPQEMITVPEGRDFSEARKIYTTYKLQVADRATGVNADTVILPEGEFEVRSVAPYQGRILAHYKVVVVR